MPRIKLIAPAKAEPELRQAYEQSRRALGVKPWFKLTPRMAQCFAHRPNLLREVSAAYTFAVHGGSLSGPLRELAVVLVSRENDCHY